MLPGVEARREGVHQWHVEVAQRGERPKRALSVIPERPGGRGTLGFLFAAPVTASGPPLKAL